MTFYLQEIIQTYVRDYHISYIKECQHQHVQTVEHMLYGRRLNAY